MEQFLKTEQVLIDREQPALNKGSIPSKFLNCRKYLSKKGTKCKALVDRSSAANKKKKSSNISDVQVATENSHSDYSYDALLLDICNVHMFSNSIKKHWTINGFLKLNPNYQCEQHVIAQDLSVKVRFLYIYQSMFGNHLLLHLYPFYFSSN